MSHQDSGTWTKSTASATSNCVEWSFSDTGVSVRDSKHPDGGRLNFTPQEWNAFLIGVRAGEADLPQTPSGRIH